MKQKVKILFTSLSTLILVFGLLQPVLAAENEEVDFSKLFGGPSEFLKIDDAFQIKTEIVDDEVIVRFEIADDYYLYRSRFYFDAKDATLAKAYIPGGKKKVDEYLGDVEVYYHNLEISVPYIPHKKEFEFILEFQGCAEAGLCYPPEEKKFILTATGAIQAAQSGDSDKAVESEQVGLEPSEESSPSSTATEVSDFVPEQEKVSNFLSDKSIIEIVLYMILLGVGLAFTPCVLPMVPILSSIIVGQGKEITTKRSFLLSLTYTQSMAIPFAIIGFIVGSATSLFGVDINSNSLQSAWFVVPAAVVFVLLSLSMFGFYELQLPAGMRNKLTNVSNSQESGTLAGAAAMGVLSALVVSPCVTVPVAGVLLYIAQTGDAVIGGAALYSLAVGMGIPLLLVGVGGGKLLPKAGGWMNSVKAAFGVGMIGMALYITKHLIPETLNMVLWSVLLIVTATFMGALSNVEANIAKLWKGIGMFIFIYGLLLMVGASMGNVELLKPLKGLSVGSSSHTNSGMAQATVESENRFIRIKSIADVERYVAEANAQGKSVMFDFFAVSCTACYEFEELVFPHPEVVKALSNAVLIQADVTANDAEDKALMKHFGVLGLPSILFFDKNGYEDKRLREIGFEEADIFTQRIEASFTANL
ncbi:MAG: protein-disulfide reductase DsbD [Kangiellaceae bacterium]|nr:protein-disulfide reductase DsbD [Kangiellaceae bacterium]